MPDEQTPSNPVILFDGFCNLCSSSVQFVIRHDPKRRFRFASLQSDYGQQILQQHNLSSSVLNSLVLYQNGMVYTKSTAAIMVAKQLSGGWKHLGKLLFIPAFLRDSVYSVISKNRYNWFGKKTSCWMPSPELKSLFIS